jgi:excinuclease ABC subunit A
MQKPDVDEIDGLSPAISIDQKAHSANPRSTVATITEIYDYLRVLFARIGEPHCPICGTKIEKMTTDEIYSRIMNKKSALVGNKKAKEIIILSPVVRGRKGEYYQMLYDLYNSGFSEVRVDGKIKSLKDRIVLAKNNKHSIEVIVDKIPNIKIWNKDDEQRLAEAVETAVDLSNGLCAVLIDKEEDIYSTEYSCPKDGFSFPEIEPRLFSFNSPYGYCDHCTGLGTKELFSEELCPKCGGKRLNENALAVKIFDKNIWEITSFTISEAKTFFENLLLNLEPSKLEIASTALNEINNRLNFMFDVGLHYLNLNRRSGTLSGGESQRIRLASQVGQQLVGALYVLDEPTIGLHQKDNNQLVNTLRNLCDIGNTIIVVEHDEDTILASDWIVDIGPKAGIHGGKIVYSGPVKEMLENKIVDKQVFSCKVFGDHKKSLTAKYLRGEEKIKIPEKIRKVDSSTPKIKIKGATENNLKNINVEIPLKRFVCLTGVSGSGKSTLMNKILYRAIANKLNHINKKVGNYKQILNTEYIDKIIRIDQRAIGRTPRSNPVTYTGAWTHIRDLFASTPEARIRGYKSGRFSFNVPGGRCEHCEGKGQLEIEMHFLPSVSIKCDVCKGRRFNNETLQVHYKNKSIADVLDMTIEEAEEFFRDIPIVYDKLKVLNDVGLNYLTLGQSAKTLSGGESQRIKISKELAKKSTSKTLYLLDEPTTGLHYDDVKKLIEVLQKLVSTGNTVMVIEHNLEVIKNADWIIDLGPEGGDKGGELVAFGTPEEIARSAFSETGKYLKQKLKVESQK